MRRNRADGINTFTIDRVAALIAWLLVVRVDDLVKGQRPPEAAALRAALDKIINTNRNAVQALKAAFSAISRASKGQGSRACRIIG
jgi:uncharacterized protein YqcC (DUF446 family)